MSSSYVEISDKTESVCMCSSLPGGMPTPPREALQEKYGTVFGDCSAFSQLTTTSSRLLVPHNSTSSSSLNSPAMQPALHTPLASSFISLSNSQNMKLKSILKYQTIGIRGSAPGCGKDTACEIICRYFASRGVKVRHEKFATPLRECVQAITGVSVEVSQTTEGKNIELPELQVLAGANASMTVGRFLQFFGREVVADHTYPNIWVDALFKRFCDEELVIISDVRFPNEQEAVKNRKGIILEIATENEVDPIYLAGRDLKHSTERALDGCEADHTILNNGTLEDLEKRVIAFLETL